ncbi:MAG: PspC domain-containing protein [Leadbetterella sp.]
MKKLYRIKDSTSMIGGVATGLSEYLEMDVTIVRLLLIGGFFVPIPVVILYIIACVIVPLKPIDYSQYMNTNVSQ